MQSQVAICRDSEKVWKSYGCWKVCFLLMLQNGEQVRVPMMRPPLVGPYAVLAQDAKGCCHLHARTAAITAAVYSLVSYHSNHFYSLNYAIGMHWQVFRFTAAWIVMKGSSFVRILCAPGAVICYASMHFPYMRSRILPCIKTRAGRINGSSPSWAEFIDGRAVNIKQNSVIIPTAHL